MFKNLRSSYDFHEIVCPDLDVDETLRMKMLKITNVTFKEYFEMYKFLIKFAYERKMLILKKKARGSGAFGRGRNIHSITKGLKIDKEEFKGLIGEITHTLIICDIFSADNIKFYFPKWLFGTSKSRGIDLIGCFCFNSQESGFIGESKFTSSSKKIPKVVESALSQAEDNIDKFNDIQKLLINARLFLQPIKLPFHVSGKAPSFLEPLLNLTKIPHTEIEKQIETLFKNKENIKLLIHVISPRISTMKWESSKFKNISVVCQSLVTCMDCRDEMINLNVLEGIS
jgi:hypothetical protein